MEDVAVEVSSVKSAVMRGTSADSIVWRSPQVSNHRRNDNDNLAPPKHVISMALPLTKMCSWWPGLLVRMLSDSESRLPSVWKSLMCGVEGGQ